MFIKYLLCLVSTEGTKINKTILTLKQLTISHGEQTCMYNATARLYFSFIQQVFLDHLLPARLQVYRAEQRI